MARNKLRLVATCLAISLLMLSFPSRALCADSEGPVQDKWALVVGISQFQNPELNLKYAAKDATDFYNYLINEGHFAKDHVRLLLNQSATRENILSQLGDEWLPRVARPDDLVLIYLSSHGSPSSMDVEGANYVVAYDTHKERLYATGIPIQEFAHIIKQRVHSNRVVLILDACHSGAAKTDEKGLYRSNNFDATQVAEGTGQLVICSSAPSQVSWESKRYENGVFTHHLIEGLRKNPKFSDTYNYLKENVQAEVLEDRAELQTPDLKSKWTGSDIALTVAPAQPRPGLREVPMIASTPASVIVPSTPSSSVLEIKQSQAVAPNTIASISAPTTQYTPPPTMHQATIVKTAVPTQTAPPVLNASRYGEYASNGKVRMKILDVEQKMTGWFVTIEIQNLTAQPLSPWYIGFEYYKDGIFLGKSSGSGVFGAGNDLAPQMRAKLDMSSVEAADQIKVTFPKPGWGPLILGVTTDPTVDAAAAASTASGGVQVNLAATSSSAAYGQYAGNGKVSMRILDTDMKMTGYFVTIEVVNNTTSPLNSWYTVFEFFKDGYFVSRSTHLSDNDVPAGARTKLETSTNSSGADEIQVKFPKPDWAPITLKLK